MFLVPLVLVAIGTPGPASAGASADVIRARYEVDLVGRSRATFALPPGPRTIRSFRWVPDPDTPGTWRSARLRLVWDGDDPEAAAVDLPLGRFVPPAADPPDDRQAAFEATRPMPYRRTGRIVIDAEGPVRGSIRLDAGPAGTTLDERGYLHARIQDGRDSSSLPSPGAIPGIGAGDANPPVRYWYDRQPGPSSPPTGGRS